MRLDRTLIDIDVHQQVQEDLQRSFKELSDIKFALDQSAIVAITDHRGIITYVNQKLCEISKYTQEELIGKNHRILNSHYHPSNFFKELWLTIKAGKVWKGEIKNKAKDGTYYWVDTTIVPFLDKQGKPYQYLSIRYDITQRKLAQQQLIHDTFHDSLTGLSNRALFINQLEQAIEQVGRHPDYLLALLFLDLDRFKVVNDSLGHSLGDQLLIALAHKLKACLNPTDLLARLGGDEFAILLRGIKDISDATRMADQIHLALTSPFRIDSHEVFTTASIGIALSSTEYDQAEHLLRDADIAMYQAKEQGKARYAIFDRGMHDHALSRMQLETGLRQALERQEFQVYYQPIVSLPSGKISGFEALVRWQHPERGMVSPAEFIPVAEDTGLIVLLGEWVLRQACCQMRIWQDKLISKGQAVSERAEASSLSPLTISVNLSVKQFGQPNFIEQIDSILNETALATDSLKLEITESALIDNTEAAADLLSQLKARKIQLSIDDFGTGYSSLSYLHRFPLDTLKIDRSFINLLGKANQKVEIVQAIATLAHTLGMDVVAEGVETAQQLELLRAMQCEYGQGYFFSQPLDARAAEALITAAEQW